MSSEGAPFVPTIHEDEEILTAFLVPSIAFVPIVLKNVLALEILELLAKSGQLSPSDIAARLSIDNPAAPNVIDRMLRFLASYSFFSCTLSEDKCGRPQRLYGLGPRSKYFVDNNGACIGPLHMLIQDNATLENWHCLKDAIKEGGTDLFTRTHGMNIFDYMATKDPRLNDIFNKGMRSLSAIYMPKVVQHYSGFSQAKTVVDVGGGVGETLKIIISKYPHIRAINYDMPHVIATAPSIPGKMDHNYLEGIEHVAGDVMKGVPKADVHFMKTVLHCGNDEFRMKVLKNCWEALPPMGKVVLVDVVIPEYPDTSDLSHSTLCVDVNLLRVGGKDLTRRELADLADMAGFHDPKYVLRVYNMWLIELHKKTR